MDRNRKKYECPTISVIRLETEQVLLAGSVEDVGVGVGNWNNGGSLGDYELECAPCRRKGWGENGFWE